MIFKNSISESILSDFIATRDDNKNQHIYVEDAKIGVLIMGNKVTTNFFGLKGLENIVGLSIYEIDSLMRPYWGITL